MSPGESTELLGGQDAETKDGATTPGSWTVAFGGDGIDSQAFEAWDRQLDHLRGVLLANLRETALQPGHRQGLSEFIVLPVAGYYMQRLGSHRVVFSWHTLHEPALRHRAINQWLSGSGRRPRPGRSPDAEAAGFPV